MSAPVLTAEVVAEEGYDPEVLRLIDVISPLADVPKKFPHWISGPDGDLGSEWCGDCGYYKVRNMRSHDRKRRRHYTLDGGWRTEEEGFRYCTSCGCRLDVSLTDYGARDELSRYEDDGFTTSVGCDAYEIGELLECVSYRHSRETDRDREQRRATVALAQRFLDELAARISPAEGAQP